MDRIFETKQELSEFLKNNGIHFDSVINAYWEMLKTGRITDTQIIYLGRGADNV